jgi:hypothetical protein
VRRRPGDADADRHADADETPIATPTLSPTPTITPSPVFCRAPLRHVATTTVTINVDEWRSADPHADRRRWACSFDYVPDLVRLPGAGDDASVRARVTDLTAGAIFSKGSAEQPGYRRGPRAGSVALLDAGDCRCHG